MYEYYIRTIKIIIITVNGKRTASNERIKTRFLFYVPVRRSSRRRPCHHHHRHHRHRPLLSVIVVRVYLVPTAFDYCVCVCVCDSNARYNTLRVFLYYYIGGGVCTTKMTTTSRIGGNAVVR